MLTSIGELLIIKRQKEGWGGDVARLATKTLSLLPYDGKDGRRNGVFMRDKGRMEIEDILDRLTFFLYWCML